MSDEPEKPRDPLDPNLIRRMRLLVLRDMGGFLPVFAGAPLADRERSILRALSDLRSGVQLLVIEGSFGNGSRCFRPVTDFVWPIGSPPAAKGALTEEALLRELAHTASALVVRRGLSGEGTTLAQLYPNEVRHVGKVLHLDRSRGVAPQPGEKRGSGKGRASATPPAPVRPGGSEPPPAA